MIQSRSPAAIAEPQLETQGQRLLDPSVTVVITCYNYAHFLGSCLDSVLAQSRPAEQVIVVDNGSTDATPQVVSRYGPAIESIRTANSGQAAAFNRGFLAARGDLVLFLDADDMLQSEAIETLLAHWWDGLAVLTFGLALIDAQGRGLGVHRGSLKADSGDNRPRLLETGTFAFPPTSGNLFSRRFLEAALPMPEARWRISADCYLVRAAALWGRAGHVPQVLGAYRLHETNNYARISGGLHDEVQHLENQRDIADALITLSQSSRLLPTDVMAAAALKAALQHRAVALRQQVASPGTKIRPASRLSSEEVRRDTHLFNLRWPPHLMFEQEINLGGPGGAFRVCPPRSGAGELIEFTVDPTPYPLVVTLGLRAASQLQSAVDICVAANGETVWSGRIEGHRHIAFPLRPAAWESPRKISLALSRPSVTLTDLKVTGDGRGRPFPALSVGHTEAAGRVLEAGLDLREWAIGPGHEAVLQRGKAVLRFSAPCAFPCSLALSLAAPVPEGWLQLERGSAVLFRGRTGAARHLLVNLMAEPQDQCLELSVSFRPDSPESGPLSLASLGLVPGPGPAPALNLGELLVLGPDRRSRRLLSSGWSTATDGTIRNAATEAALSFLMPAGAQALVLRVAPSLDSAEAARHILAVSQDGELRKAAHLAGDGEFAVPLAPKQGACTLVLHSFYHDPEGAPSFASFGLQSVALEGKEPDLARPLLPLRQGLPPPLPFRLLKEAAHLLAASGGPAAAGELTQIRSTLAEIIAKSASSLHQQLAASHEAMTRLEAVGFATRHQPWDPAEQAAVSLMRAADGEAEVLRACLLSMLLLPPFESPVPRLSALPAPLLWQRGPLAAWLGRAPDISDAAMHGRYRTWLEVLLADVETILASAPQGGALYDLAARTLASLRSTGAIFGQGNLRSLIRLRSRCIERRLTRSGAQLTLPRAPRAATSRLRLGVLARDVLPNPEGWAVLGMYQCLDRESFEPILIRMDEGPESLDTGERFEESLCLKGLSIEQSVAAIRALDLDLLLTGCYVADWEKTSAIVAHRLAAVQVWHGAVCPTTGGFRSFDFALTCRATEPDDPQRHYTETVAWIDGPLQCAYAFPTTSAEPGLRAAIGVPEGAEMLASGAMAHKISDELLATWAAILVAAPQAVLVLYPFAANWSMAFASEAFRARVDRVLDAYRVAHGRAIILGTQTPERARHIAAAADLYLDSFPYTGATTVCEALSSGTPVLTCEGDGLRERTGASWVRAFGLPELVARTPGEYCAIAARLLQNPAQLQAHRAAVARQAPAPCDPVQFGATFSNALWRLAENSGLFPHLEGRPLREPPVAAPALRRTTQPMVRLAILASPRTGSSLLCELLQRLPNARCHYELFHEDMIQYGRGRYLHNREAITARDSDPMSFLARVMDEAEAEGLALCGFKHLCHQNPSVLQAVIRDPSFRIVVLSRTNLIAQHSSLKIATSTGRWLSLNGESLDRVRVPFDPARFESWERYQTGVEHERRTLLHAAGREALFLDYEHLLEPRTAERLSEHLGIEILPSEAFEIQRQNSPNVLDRFTNPEEVVAYFQDRGLAGWLAGSLGD